MMNTNEIQQSSTGSPNISPLSKVRWSPIIAGAIASTILGILLNFLGMGVGLSLLKASYQGLITVSIVGVIWMMIATFIGNYAGGMIAVRLIDRIENSQIGILHALFSWAIATMIYLVAGTTALGNAIGGVSELITASTSHLAKITSIATPQLIQTAQKSQPVQEIENKLTQQAEGILQRNNAQQMNEQLKQSLQQFLAGDQRQMKEAKESVKNILMKNANMSEAEANQTIDNWANKYREAKEQTQIAAKQAAEYAGGISGGTMLVIFFFMLIGAFGAFLGGRTVLKSIT